MNLTEAVKIFNKNKSNCKIKSIKEFPDKFVFIWVPEGVDENAWTNNPLSVMKKDGSVSYSMIYDFDKGTKIDLSELKHWDTNYSYLCHSITQ